MKHSRESITPWATPFDVHCVERERFPMPVSRSRWADRLTFGLLCALASALTTLIAVGLVINLTAP